VTLAGERPYKVDALDPWEMKEWPVGSAAPGAFAVPVAPTDLVYRLVPYGAGEKRRPEARASASALEGPPPLTVRFSGSGGERAEWDFGDGATASGREAAHTFSRAGLYSVVLKVTDGDGASAQSRLIVAVDRDPSVPFVRAGFPQGEVPELRLRGKAARKEGGSIHLPAGEPWGWAEAGTGPMEDLRGLRSFTLLGWVRPESLETGSGGNRIVHCMNGDRAGIDLVSLADGRLRLSVNEWPDRVKNDSAPGRLEAGKWVFFAVTYDALSAARNVSWYFGPPMGSPGPAEVSLDRRTTYNSGPVGADVGGLALGNFNETMRGNGLDRQFRGEIRGLQIFGSRIGSRGALALERIQEAAR